MGDLDPIKCIQVVVEPVIAPRVDAPGGRVDGPPWTAYRRATRQISRLVSPWGPAAQIGFGSEHIVELWLSRNSERRMGSILPRRRSANCRSPQACGFRGNFERQDPPAAAASSLHGRADADQRLRTPMVRGAGAIELPKKSRIVCQTTRYLRFTDRQ